MEPTRIYDLIKQLKTFHQSILASILLKTLIILGQCNTKNDRRRIFKDLYPSLPLRPLTSNIEEIDAKDTGTEGCPSYAGRLGPSTKDVEGGGHEIWSPKSIDFIKETKGLKEIINHEIAYYCALSRTYDTCRNRSK